MQIADCRLQNESQGTVLQSTIPRHRRGFTLIEVLTTMVVMAIILPVAMHGISVSLQAAEIAKRTAVATTLADGKLNDLASATQSVSAGTTSGDFMPDFPGYQWQATTTSLSLGLLQIDVQVSWTARDGPRKLSVSTLVYPQTGSGT
jgi:prepilin-type N-terminal cleavage/methylation domain-containing protein